MKVHELITILEKMPPNAEVITEGCDCEGESNGVLNRPELDEVLICRYFNGEVPERLLEQAVAYQKEREERIVRYRNSLPAEKPFKFAETDGPFDG